MEPSIFAQIAVGIVILPIMLVVPSVTVYYGWSGLRSEIYRDDVSIWRRITVSLAILAVTVQTTLFLALLIAIFRYRVLAPYSALLFKCVFAELVLLLFAALCAFGWRGRVRWWLFVSCLYLPAISFFSTLAVLAY